MDMMCAGVREDAVSKSDRNKSPNQCWTKKRRQKGKDEENSLILSLKLEMLSLSSDEKLSIDPVSETVCEIDRAPPSASAFSRVNWRKTCREKIKVSEKETCQKAYHYNFIAYDMLRCLYHTV